MTQPTSEPHPSENDWEHLAQEYLDGWKRATADYQNLQKETAKEKQEIVQYANANLLLSLLPVVDHFSMALEHIPDDQQQTSWMTGMQHIYRQLLEVLKSEGVEKIETVGQSFHPDQHEAVGKRKEKGVPADQILEEARAGYLYHGRIIQPARVIIAE